MINLKLAQYNKKGEFEKFLELGGDYGNFFYSGEYVGIYNSSEDIKDGRHYLIDKKDPFNRFDGLFDGRTYGGGKFVLIENDCDDIIKGFDRDYRWLNVKCRLEKHQTENRYDDFDCDDYVVIDIIGNIHENPELWSKIN